MLEKYVKGSNMHACSFYDDVTIETITKAYTKYGWNLFTEGDYNLNIFGIRANESKSNTFNDLICVLYKVNGEWVLKKYDATTDPGTYYRENPINKNGTAILKEGRYSGSFGIGLHHGKYRCLVQVKPLQLYRDNNKDNILDKKGTTSEEMAAIHIHRASASATSKQVDKWSAGCQVIASSDNFKEFMSLVDTSAKYFKPVFTYILFNETDLAG